MGPEAGSRIWAPPVEGGVRRSTLPTNMRRPCGKATISSSVASKLGSEMSVLCSVSGKLIVGILQVIYIHIKQWNIFELARDRVLEVHLRSPVNALVISDQRRRASGGHQSGIAQGLGECISALDGMCVARGLARSDDWIHPTFDKGTFAIEVIDGECASVLCSCTSSERG